MATNKDDVILRGKALKDLRAIKDMLVAAGDPFLASVMNRAIACIENQPAVEAAPVVNERLTAEEMKKLYAPVWVKCKPIECGDGFWCICNYGIITTPAGTFFGVDEIPKWEFYREPPSTEEERHG